MQQNTVRKTARIKRGFINDTPFSYRKLKKTAAWKSIHEYVIKK